jgi:hypothetical protein
MDTSTRHEFSLVTSSLEELKDVLPTAAKIDTGTVIELDEDMSLEVSKVSKSSGFDMASLIVTGVVTVATSVSTELLIAWAKAKLSKSKAKGSSMTIIINGSDVKIELPSGESE